MDPECSLIGLLVLSTMPQKWTDLPYSHFHVVDTYRTAIPRLEPEILGPGNGKQESMVGRNLGFGTGG